ncbi:hypothetical protein K0B96_03260 [Horticoccus luteus]|uniref:YVTN family beta-propeller protein n=1 Tax=Horticoccus luteus TaxID=2862869 RepID=A0A8F9TY25_9BACT|nr:hypothetical protein [Horticoccus luteus]QYM79652.1 hypothetical protein K0B96_03260 [Horticoccus luteus]
MNALSRVLLIASFSLVPMAAAHAADVYRFTHEIPIGGEGGWDYLSVEPASHRLFVSHASRVVVIDTRKDAIVGEIADTPGVHGVAPAPELGLGFVSNGRADNVSIVELATLKTVGHVATGKNPDAILYEPERREVYAFNGHGQSVTVFAAAGGKVVATIPLGGKPEFAQADGGRVFVNLEDKNEVAVIATATHAVIARWPIAPDEEASGMAIDHEHHRLFLGCGNARLLVLDSTDGRVVASLPAGAGIDAAAFDPGTQLAFVSNGHDGTVTVVHEDSPERFAVVQTLPTQRSARTLAVDPVSHKLYLAAALFHPAEAGRRPAMIAGSMKVLVYSLVPAR